MRGFLDMECDGRTNGRTDKRDSLRSIGVAERPKKLFQKIPQMILRLVSIHN